MTDTIRAIYENGVLRPLESLNLEEHQEVRLTVQLLVRDADAPDTSDVQDPLANIRVSTGIKDLAEHFDDYRIGRRRP